MRYCCSFILNKPFQCSRQNYQIKIFYFFPPGNGLSFHTDCLQGNSNISKVIQIEIGVEVSEKIKKNFECFLLLLNVLHAGTDSTDGRFMRF